MKYIFEYSYVIILINASKKQYIFERKHVKFRSEGDVLEWHWTSIANVYSRAKT